MIEPSQDWSRLIGRTVELKHYGRLIRTAELEDVSWDSSILWLRFDGADGRQLVEKADGYEINVVD